MVHADWRRDSALCLAGFLCACGGDGGGAGLKTRDAGAEAAQSDGSSSAGSDASAAEVTATALHDACVGACEAQSQCLQISQDVCADDCKAQAASLPADCRDEALAEQSCLAGLTCDEARDYAVSGRRTHSVCGKAATAFFDACTLGHGVTPQACSELCAHYDGCGLLQVTPAACEEQCTLEATNYDQQGGSSCSDAFLAFMACGADATCADAKDLLEQQLAPGGCESQLDALNGACH
jgi:hypothetical protein